MINFFLLKIRFFFVGTFLFLLVSCNQTNRNSYGEHISASIEKSPMMQRLSHEYLEINMDHPIEISADSLQNKLVDISYIPLDSKELIGEVDRVLLYNEKMVLLQFS